MLKLAIIGVEERARWAAANYLAKNKGFKRKDIREPIDDIMRKLYYWGEKHVRSEVKWAYYDAFYKLDHKIWVGHLERRILLSPSDIVVSDPRYVDEVLYLQNMGFTIIRLVVPLKSKQKPIGARLSNKFAYQKPEDGTVLIQEVFGKRELYKVDYSIYYDTKEHLAEELDRIVDLERSKIV